MENFPVMKGGSMRQDGALLPFPSEKNTSPEEYLDTLIAQPSSESDISNHEK